VSGPSSPTIGKIQNLSESSADRFRGTSGQRECFGVGSGEKEALRGVIRMPPQCDTSSLRKEVVRARCDAELARSQPQGAGSNPRVRVSASCPTALQGDEGTASPVHRRGPGGGQRQRESTLHAGQVTYRVTDHSFFGSGESSPPSPAQSSTDSKILLQPIPAQILHPVPSVSVAENSWRG
jgi:hypothetical protein